MNISPVSFGKVVEVRGETKSTAYNLASLANSKVENKSHKAIQKDVKELFDDVTPKGKVRVYEAPSGEVFLLSGKDAEVVTFDERDAQRKIRREETSHKLIDSEYIKEIKDNPFELMESLQHYLMPSLFLASPFLKFSPFQNTTGACRPLHGAVNISTQRLFLQNLAHLLLCLFGCLEMSK